METSQANDQAGGSKPANKPSIDSLRTVEFRTTLRGYHMDDVDEYLERVAVEAEALQEQMRLSAERFKQAANGCRRLSSNWSRRAGFNRVRRADRSRRARRGG